MPSVEDQKFGVRFPVNKLVWYFTDYTNYCMKYNCKFCGKEFNTGYGNNIFCSHSCCSKYAAQSIEPTKAIENIKFARTFIKNRSKGNWECNECGKIFDTRRLLYEHKHAFPHVVKRGTSIKELYTCPFCKKEWETTSSGFGTHKRKCLENPNRIPSIWEGRKRTPEERKKISEGAKKAHDEGRGHTWKNRYLNPSYAEQWLYGLLDSNHIEYEKEKPFFGFFLDVAIGNKCIEIDGEQHGEDTRFPEQIERDKRKDELLKENGWKELRVKWSDIKKMPEYFTNKILDFINNGETVFDGEYITYKQKTQEMLERKQKLINDNQVNKLGYATSSMLSDAEWERRKNLILSSGVDLNKFGCLKELKSKTGLTRRQICNVINKFNIKHKTHHYKYPDLA